MLLLYDDAIDPGPGGVLPDFFFNILPELERDGREHRLSALSKVVAVKVLYRETIAGSVPNPRSRKFWNRLETFPSSVAPQSSKR